MNHRLVISVLAAIAMIAASQPAQGDDAFRRFSLLDDPVTPHGCLTTPSTTTGASDEEREECALLEIPPLADFSDVRPPLTVPADEAKSEESDGEKDGYALSDRWSAAVVYHHELLSPTASNEDLRTRRFSLFSADPDRDVFDLRLSWHVSRMSDFNLGYQFQSNRTSLAAAAESYSVRRLMTDTDFDHAITIGITRRFGGPQ